MLRRNPLRGAMVTLEALLVSAAGLDSHAQGTDRFGVTAVETICLDDNATGYGTFQSHNQKVVSNRNGIFTTHIRTRNEPYTAQTWRLSRSTDRGNSFTTVYEATHATNPPALETDEEGNLYLVRPDFLDGHSYLYRFLAADEYAQPVITTIPNSSHGKFCLLLDRGRRQLYYFSANNTFHIIGLDGAVRSAVTLLQPGESALLQYPLLAMGPDGTLYAAWTTQAHGRYLYWDIHCMKSPDGGLTWQKLDGTPLALPVTADEHGLSDRITLDDEYEAHTWLSSFLVKAGKLHFLYLVQCQPPRQHYMRYDVGTAARELDLQPEFKGERISLAGLDGFFASDPGQDKAPLYCVMACQGRIGCLVSEDNGQTWHDYALSDLQCTPYSIGGCRELTADGYIIGSFTDQASTPPRVYFIRIKAGVKVGMAAG